MSAVIFIEFCVLLSIEAILICLGNTFAIFVFWKKGRTLQRAYYLLINLAVADLLVGLMQIVSLGAQSQPWLFSDSDPNEEMNGFHYSYLLESLQILFPCSSVFSLAVISLDRVYAVLWPLRHRTVNGRVYFGSIAFTWAAGSGAAVLHLLSSIHILSPLGVSTVTVNTTILSSLCVVCISYVSIRKRLRRTLPIFDNQSRRNMERNVKLSKTLFIVMGLSLVCWTPGLLVYPIYHVCKSCIASRIPMLVATVLHLGNSIVNPVVYSYRMPMFKEELKRFFNNCNFLKHPRNEDTPPSDSHFDTPL